MNRVFKNFSEVEEHVRTNAPSVIYKYRDWNNDLHKKVLTENLIWFASAKSLNDPNDIRMPYTFNFDEVNHPKFFENLKKYAKIQYPHIAYDSIEFNKVCEYHFNIIKTNPQKWFLERFKEIRDSDIYNLIGLFSTTTDPCNETMWAHYGNNGKGVCIGFDTIELVKNLTVSFGPAIYRDEPLPYSFLEGKPATEENEYRYKHSKWSYEKEFRLFSFLIKKDSDRLMSIPKQSIREVILGIETDVESQNEIISLLKSKYESKVELFKSEISISAFGLSLTKIDY